MYICMCVYIYIYTHLFHVSLEMIALDRRPACVVPPDPDGRLMCAYITIYVYIYTYIYI